MTSPFNLLSSMLMRLKERTCNTLGSSSPSQAEPIIRSGVGALSSKVARAVAAVTHHPQECQKL